MDVPDYELEKTPLLEKEVSWKAVAIFFIALFIILLAINTWGVITVLDDEAKMDECYYEICADYSEAKLIEEICYCYKGGNWELDKTTSMKD